ncbi:MAG TPA: hypothetical protein VHD87_15690 [Acidimicrobiales bacterium]|nr:hypothetical protein [Acidimicrobiales bacterium]
MTTVPNTASPVETWCESHLAAFDPSARAALRAELVAAARRAHPSAGRWLLIDHDTHTITQADDDAVVAAAGARTAVALPAAA